MESKIEIEVKVDWAEAVADYFQLYLTNQANIVKLLLSQPYLKEEEEVALKMSPESQLLIFKTLFGNGPEVKIAAGLSKYGVTFAVGGNDICATYKDIMLATSLPVPTSTIINGVIPHDKFDATLFQASSFLTKVCLKLGVTTGSMESLAPQQDAEAVAAGEPVAKIGSKSNAMKEKIAKEVKEGNKVFVAGVVKLRDAQVTGQKVFGTSQGSVYQCVALNPRVKLATRIVGNTVSFRAECDFPKPEELKSLEEVGLQDHGSYLSMHITAGEVPARRIIGAVLYSSGINFDSVLLPAELVEA